MNAATLQRTRLPVPTENMTFAPRYSPDGRTVIFSLTDGGNSDIYSLDMGSGGLRRLTNAPSIETAPSFSPDGSQIVFESDRSGTQQLYVMPAGGGEAHADQLRAGSLRHARLVAAGGPHRLHQAERRALPHRRDADGRQRGAAPDRVVPRRGADLEPERPRHHVHARNRGGRGRAAAVLRRHLGAEPQDGANGRIGVRSGLVAAFALEAIPFARGRW